MSQACAEIAQLLGKVEEAAAQAQKEEEEEGAKRQSKRKDHYMVELEQGKFADLLMNMGGRSSVSSGYNSLSQGGDSEWGDTYLGSTPAHTKTCLYQSFQTSKTFKRCQT